MCLAAELAQVDAADLAAALGVSLAAQVASQRPVRNQRFQEDLVQRQVVSGQPGRSRRRDIHLGVTVWTEHRYSFRLRRLTVTATLLVVPVAARRQRERLQLADTIGAEGVQTREDPGVPV